MPISTIIMLFFFYSFMGWVSEVVYCSLIERRFVNRGFLVGPLCPVYGFGGLLVVFLLEPFTGNVLYLFVMAMAVTTVLEYVTGWALESIFSTKWWDYSQYRFNIHGRVCLLNSVLFGIMGVVALCFVHPAALSFIGMISPETRVLLAAGFSAVLFVDFAYTLRSLVDFSAKLASLTEFMDSVTSSIDFGEWFNEKDLKASLERLKERARVDATEFNARITEKLEQLIDRAKGMQHLVSAFPGMTSRRHDVQLTAFKRLFNVHRSATEHTAMDAPRGSARDALQGSTRPVLQPSGVVEFLFVFLVSSFLGSVIETLWGLGSGGVPGIRSALVFGYLNPLYGSAVIALSVLYSRISKWRDLGVIVLFSAVLYLFVLLVGLLQDVLLSSGTWSFVGPFDSVRGDHSLLFIVALSVLSLFWIRDILPLLIGVFRKMNRNFAAVVIVCVFLCAIADAAVSFGAVKRWVERKNGLEAASAPAHLLDRYFPDEVLTGRFPWLRVTEDK